MSVNGRLMGTELSAIPWQPDERCAAHVLYSLCALNVAFRARYGHDIHVTSAYRTWADQDRLYRSLGAAHAYPAGQSDHGLGIAFDFGSGIQTYQSAQWSWMGAHAGEFGFTRFKPTKPSVEPWHWNCYNPIRVPMPVPEITEDDDMFTEEDRARAVATLATVQGIQATVQNVENLLARDDGGESIRTIARTTRDVAQNVEDILAKRGDPGSVRSLIQKLLDR